LASTRRLTLYQHVDLWLLQRSGSPEALTLNFDAVITCRNGLAGLGRAIPIKLYIGPGARVPTFSRTYHLPCCFGIAILVILESLFINNNTLKLLAWFRDI